MRLRDAALVALTAPALAQNVVQFDLSRRPAGSAGAHLRRRATYTESLANNITGGGYYAQVQVGTPGQNMTMVLDTGSSDAWVIATDADLCTSQRLQTYYQDSCSETYNKNASSTYKLVQAKGFTIQYLDGGTAAGDYITETMQIGGTTVKSLQMGLASKVVRGTGILGVGYPANEASISEYPNLIDQMLQQGLISTKGYSLYLNDRRSDAGAILFGGMDTDKFIGELGILNVVKSTVGYTSLAVSMSGMSVTYGNGSTVNITVSTTPLLAGSSAANTMPAILDSGTTLTYLPASIASQMFTELKAFTDYRSTGLTFVDCGYLKSESAMTFNFTFAGSKTIAVPVTEMVLDVLGGYTDLLPGGIPFTDVCLFGIQSSGDSAINAKTTTEYALLGDTFLRSAYIVYDMTSNQIGLAQANLNSTDSSIVELKAGGGIPSATGVASQVVLQTSTTSTGGSSTSTGGGSGGSSTTNNPSSGATSSNAAARSGPAPPVGEAFAVVAVAGLFSLVGGAAFLL